MSNNKFTIHVISVAFERLGELKVFVQSWLNQTENNWKLTVIHDGKNADLLLVVIVIMAQSIINRKSNT